MPFSGQRWPGVACPRLGTAGAAGTWERSTTGRWSACRLLLHRGTPSKEHAMFSRLATKLIPLAAGAVLSLAAGAQLAQAQTNSKPTPPAQKTPAKPGAQSGPDAAASAASGP